MHRAAAGTCLEHLDYIIQTMAGFCVFTWSSVLAQRLAQQTHTFHFTARFAISLPPL